MVPAAGPTTHITSLASLTHYCIQMVDPWDLFYALDCSTDLPSHKSMDEHFGALLDRKYQNCTEWYLTNLATLGVQEPLVVIIRSDNGDWQMDEGHHRLSWALRSEIPFVPVIFDDSGADDESNMGYLVGRTNVDAYHDTVLEEFLVPIAAEKLFEEPAPSVALAAKKLKSGDYEWIPQPRPVLRPDGGRHRAK